MPSLFNQINPAAQSNKISGEQMIITGNESGFLYTCKSCNQNFFQIDVQFLNDIVLCQRCFDKIPEEQKKNMTCRVPGCKGKRRDDRGSEYCDFHLDERMMTTNDMISEFNRDFGTDIEEFR